MKARLNKMKKEIEDVFEEFEEDFDLQEASYQVVIFGYDEDDMITDFEATLFSSNNPDKAVDFAQSITEKTLKDIKIPDDVAYLGIEVETVVETENESMNIGSIYFGRFLVKKD